MSRLPIPGSDDNVWGNLLNDFLNVEHNPDGSLKKSAAITSAEQSANKGVAGGYASLNTSGVVPATQLGTGTPTAGTFLKGDNTWGVISGGASDATTGSKGIVQLAGDLGGTAASPTVPGLAAKANDTAVVHLAGSETISGAKIFSAAPTVPTPSLGGDAANKTYVDTGLSAKPDNSLVVHSTGSETVAGVKTFSSSPIVPTPTGGTDAVNKTYADGLITGTATDSAVVHKTGTESITGLKHFDKVTFKTGPWVDVTHPDFGADPTGGVDATVIINNAMAYAVSSGIGIVYLPKGTYKVNPQLGTNIYALTIPAGLKCLRGAGMNLTTIKVDSSVGEYRGIIASNGNDASDFCLEDLTIDQNQTGNTLTATVPLLSGGSAARPRYCVALTTSTTYNAVRRVRFKDTDNVNSLAITASSKDTLIQDCRFEIGVNPLEHDHSSIYSNNSGYTAASVVIMNNTFDTPGQVGAAKASRTAIESHGGAQKIIGNVIRGYQKGMNVTGVSVYVGAGIHVTGNSIHDAKFGIQLWSLKYSTNQTDGIKNVHIKNNTIHLNGPAWASMFGGNGYASGIFLDLDGNGLPTTPDLPFEDVNIIGNDITFINQRDSGYVGQSGDSLANGIDWRRNPLGLVTDRRVRICGNTIDGSTASGIRINVNGDFFDVSDNIINNPGCGTIANGGALSNGSGNGIFMSGVFTNSRVNNNMVRDVVQTDNTMPDYHPNHSTNIGIYLYPGAAGSSNNQAIGNRVPYAISKKIEMAGGDQGGWLIDMDHNSYSAITGTVTVGSQIRDTSTGTVYRQITAPQGTTWKSYTPGNVQATDLAFALPGTLYLPGTSGNYLTTPSFSGIDVTGTLRLRVDVALDDWSTTNYLLSRWTNTSNLVWNMYVSGGRLAVAVVTTGQVASSGLISASNGDRLMLEAVINPSTGTVAFNKSTNGGSSWTSLGSNSNTIGGAFTWPSGTNVALSMGGYSGASANFLKGYVYAADVYDSGSSTTLAHLDITSPATTMTDSQSHTWSLLGSGSTITPQFMTSSTVMLKANNLGDVSSVATARTNLGLGGAATLNVGTTAGTVAAGDDSRFLTTTPFPARPNVTGQWAILTGRPYALSLGGATYSKDVWRYVPFRLETSWTIDAIAINVSTAAATGTAAMIFGLFASDSNNRPAALQTDWSTFGSMDLTTTGVKTLTMTNTTIASGDWYIGCAWTGTATPTNPAITGFNTSVFPGIYMPSATFPASGYAQTISGASVPTTAAPTSVGVGAAIWVQMH